MANEAEVDLVVSTAGALPQLERDLSRIIRVAENDADAIDVPVAIDTQRAVRDLSIQLDRAAARAEGNLDGIEVGVLIDQRDALRTLDRQLGQIVDDANRGIAIDDPVLIRAALDGPESIRNMRTELEAVVDRVQATAPDVEVDVEVDVDRQDTAEVSRLSRSLNGLRTSSITAGRGVGTLVGGVAALSLGAGGLVNTLAAVAAGLQQVAPAAAVGTSALLTLKLATGTLQLAMIGVEDAIKDAFDPSISVDDFHKSLKGLAPEARLFVDQIHTMRRELRAIQQGVQNRVFKDLDDDLRSLSKNLGSTVTGSLNRAADSLNAMARNAVTAAVQMGQQGVLGQALEGANDALETLEKAPARVVRSFSFLAAASAPALNRIALAIDDVSLKVQEKLQRAFESGALERAIDEAVSSLAQLGTVLGNFGSGVGNIFSGLTEGGRGLFEILESLSESFERLTASREFQSILNELALTADVLIDTLTPLIEEAFKQLGPVIEELAPVIRDFVSAVGPELIPILQELGPILVDIALIMKEQLPLAIDLANAALDALQVALVIVGGALDIARQGAEQFSAFYQSDFVSSFRTASNAAVTHRDVLIDAFQRWTARALSLVLDFQSSLAEFSANVRQTVVAAFVGMGADIARTVQSVVQFVVTSFQALPGRMFTIGVQVMQGLASGLTSGVGRVLGIARDIAESVSSTVERALDINSPSRVMAELGKFTVQGFAKGMEAELPSVRSAAKKLSAIPAGILGPRGGSLEVAQARLPSLPTVTGRGTSVVQVYIGNQLVEQFINDRVKAFNAGQNRIKVQGVRL